MSEFLVSAAGLIGVVVVISLIGFLTWRWARDHHARQRNGLLALVVLASLGAPSCADCFKPASEKYPTKGCVIARQAVDCATSAAKGEVAPGIAVAKTLIDSGTVDVPVIEQSLLMLGFHFSECIIQALVSDFSKASAAPAGPLPPNMVNYRASFLVNYKTAKVAP